MISRFHFSQKDNKKDIKENESLPGMEESTNSQPINNNDKFYDNFSQWEKYQQFNYYQPQGNFPFFDGHWKIVWLNNLPWLLSIT